VVGFGLDVIGVELRVPALAGGDFEWQLNHLSGAPHGWD
jgi:hypothetical protein